MAPPVKFTAERKRELLKSLRETCNQRKAAVAAGVSVGTVQQARHADPAFAAAYRAALAEGSAGMLQRKQDAALEAAGDDWNGPGANNGWLLNRLAKLELEGGAPKPPTHDRARLEREVAAIADALTDGRGG